MGERDAKIVSGDAPVKRPGALVLAGGASQRMGRDKASVDFGGLPLLVRVLACLTRCCTPLVVAARAGQQLPPLGELSVTRVDDPVAGPTVVRRGAPPVQGPLVGLAAGLEQLAALGVEHCYLGSCDAAALSEVHVRFMLARLAACAPSCAAVVPRAPGGFVHPLAAALRVDAMLARVRAQLAAGEARLQRLFAGEGIESIEEEALPDPAALAPCNTPAQLHALALRLER